MDFGFYKPRFNQICKHCGKENSRSHVTNECEAFKELTDRTMNLLKKKLFLGKLVSNKLEDMILYAYYNPVKNKLNDVMNILRDFAISLVIKNAKVEKGNE